MPILPVDLQAMVMRLEHLNRMQYHQQEAVALAQSLKNSEMDETSRLQATRVNEVQQQDENSTVNDEQSGQRRPQERARSGGRESGQEQKQFEEPFKGRHIDTTR
jgi:hypothetical protein